MLFHPAQLGLAHLDKATLEADKKACKKIGPCGVGKKALYLNSFYIDRRYYLPYGSIRVVDNNSLCAVHCHPIEQSGICPIDIPAYRTDTTLFSINASTGGLDIVAKIVNKYCHLNLGSSVMVCGCIICSMAILVYHLPDHRLLQPSRSSCS